MSELATQEATASAVVTQAVPRSLPFTFAKQHGVLLDRAEDGSPLVVHEKLLSVQVLTELRRLLGQSFTLLDVSEGDFKRRLTLAYHHDRSGERSDLRRLGK